MKNVPGKLPFVLSTTSNTYTGTGTHKNSLSLSLSERCAHTPDRPLLLTSLCIFADVCWLFVSLSVVCLTIVCAMEWMTFCCAFCASMPPESRVICVCLFLHWTVSLMYQCPPFSVADQRLQEPSVLSCAHGQSLRDSYSGPLQEDLSCTALPHPPRRYSPDQILAVQAATPDPLTSRLRDLGIGCLLRKPSSRGGRRKQRKIAVVCDGAARLTTQPPNDLLQCASSARRSVSNLITVVSSGDSRADHASTETVHNSRLTMAYFNAQSVRQIAGEFHDSIADN